MRFKEIKFLLREAEATAPSGYYTVGDSHAVAVATAGGKGWTNLAIGGRSSTDQEMLGNISKIPKGAVVLVSQGANDTANAMKSAELTKKPPKDPKAIAASVANVVNKVRAQGATPIFMLFPNGPGRGAGLAKYYGGDYQEEVRSAIKGVLGNTEIIDINGKPLTDGIHAGMATYKEVANQVMAKSKPAAAPAPVGGKPAPGQFTVTLPSGNKSPEVADLQKALIALGFPLPQHGVDGIRGPETSGAIRNFQKANNINPSGTPDQPTVDAVNAALADKPEVLATLKKSTDADIKPAGGAAGPMPPLKQDSVTTGKIGKLLDFIARYESGGNYEIILGGKTINGLTKATIADVFKLQDAMRAKGMESTAVGRYQYIKSTLEGTIKQMGLNPESTTFDEKTQDAIATQTLRTIGLDQWLDGKLDDSAFLNKVARVWAGIPTTGGTSAYQGVGSNKAGTTTQTALNTLQDIKTATA